MCPTHLVKSFVVVKEPEGTLVHSVAPLGSLLAFYGNWLAMHLLRKGPGTHMAFLGSQDEFTWCQYCPVSGLLCCPGGTTNFPCGEGVLCRLGCSPRIR